MTITRYYTLELSEGSWDETHETVAEALTTFKRHLEICPVCRDHKVKCRVIGHVEETQEITGWLDLTLPHWEIGNES